MTRSGYRRPRDFSTLKVTLTILWGRQENRMRYEQLMRCRVPGDERTTGAYRGHGLHVHDGNVVGLPTGVVRGDAEHDVLGSMCLEHASLLLHADDRIALFLCTE